MGRVAKKSGALFPVFFVVVPVALAMIVTVLVHLWAIILVGLLVWALAVSTREPKPRPQPQRRPAPQLPPPDYLRRWSVSRQQAVRYDHGEWEAAFAWFERDAVARPAAKPHGSSMAAPVSGG